MSQARRVLLDEAFDTRLRNSFMGEFVAATVEHEDLKGCRNGELIDLALERGYEAIVTPDQSFHRSHKISELGMPIFILVASSSEARAGASLSAYEKLVPTVTARMEWRLDNIVYVVGDSQVVDMNRIMAGAPSTYFEHLPPESITAGGSEIS